MYYFKNKDTILATLNKIGDHFELIDLYVSLDITVLYMLRSNDALNNWIDNRQTPLSRPYTMDLLKQAGIKSRVDFVDISKCLSVTDTLWITNKNEKLEEVSLFQNSFTKAYTDIASGFKGFNGRPLKSPSPELGIDGNSRKCFKRYSNDIYLYKTSGGLAELEYSGVYSEYFSSQLLSALGINQKYYTIYDIVKYNETLWSKCKLFTNENIGLIAVENIFNDFEHLEEHILHYTDVQLNLFRLLMLVDCLLLNVDRHGENISFIYNNDTLAVLGLSPIYDFDHSLFYDVSLLNRSTDYIVEKVLCKFPRTYHSKLFIDQFRYCLTNDFYNRIKQLYDYNFQFKNHKLYPMDSERLILINKVFRWHLNQLLRG